MVDLDPLSAVNLARASDPWYDNNLVKVPSKTLAEIGPKAHDVTVHGTEGDVGGDVPRDDEWGEFVTFSGQQDENRGAAPVSVALPDASTPPPSSKTSKQDGDRHARRSLASLSAKEPQRGSNPSASISTPYAGYPACSRASYQARNSMPNLPAQRPIKSFSDVVLERIASAMQGDRGARSSSFGGLFSLASASSTRAEAPPRGYDSYDVTFESGPIGLELETDWYGRQAVVKGFTRVNNGAEEGPAKLCGFIRVGDVLTAINGASCLDLAFAETLARLRAVRHERHVLHFTSLEVAGDLSGYRDAPDIAQAKRFIHEHKEKFYQPPRRVKRTAAAQGTSASAQTSRSREDRAHAPSSSSSSSSSSASASSSVFQQQGELVLGCVERLRGPSVTAFNLHREDTGEFVLACSCVNDATGAFLFHTLRDSHLREWRELPRSEDSAVFLGLLSPNLLGTEFTLLDHQQQRRHNELGFLEYASNVLGRVPNSLRCVFPCPREPSDGDEDEEDKEGDGEEEGMEAGNGVEAQSEGRGNGATDRAARDGEGDGRRSEEEDALRAPHAPAVDSGMGDDRARFNTHRSGLADRHGRLSERYKRLQQSRRLSVVERLRALSLRDLDVGLELAAAAEGVAEGVAGAGAWLDADDHAGRARAMRVQQARLAGAGWGRRADALGGVAYGAVEADEYASELLVLETKQPAWNEALGAWTLNFQGRVKLASKKNFLLVAAPQDASSAAARESLPLPLPLPLPPGEDRVLLRFGKVSKTRFSLDYAAPLSPMLALAVAASSFARKIAVT